MNKWTREKKYFSIQFITQRQMYAMERIKKKKQMKSLKCTEKVLRNNMMKFKPLFFAWKYEFFKV